MTDYRMLNVNEGANNTSVKFMKQRLCGEDDNQELGKELFRLVERDGVRKLLLNFNGVTLVSSGALGKLITLCKKMEEVGGVVIFCNIHPQIQKVLDVTHLNKLFNIQSDEEAARRAF